MSDAVRPQPNVPFYLAIAGNIGVGKSSVTELVGRAYGWRTFYEPVINNPYLDDYYRDMRRWAFQLQVYFLSQRFQLQKTILDGGGSAVQDRTIYEDVEIFAPTLHRRGCIDDRDYATYRDIFRNMTAFLRPPDLVIYLRATPDTTLARIQRRGRECEQNVPRDFIMALHEAYEAWAERAGDLCPLAVVDAETTDFRADADAREHLFALIERHHAAAAARRGGS